jgi:acetylornithine deacetylase/succinyl-diaminopimelate desuccinylase-like protein
MEIELQERVLDLAAAVQQIPAPAFAEAARAAFICERFQAEGLESVAIDAAGNACACIRGEGRARPLVISAHLDSVFPLATHLALKRFTERLAGPGIGDNALGVAGLLGLHWGLQQRSLRLSGDVWLVANVGEEGLGDLRGMRAVIERFGDRPLAYLILEGMALGQVYHRGLGVQRYRITVRTAGGHSWVDYGRPSAVHELGELIHRLASLPIPGQPRSSLNVGVISGGTSINTIAAQASLELDLRSENVQTLADLAAQVERLVFAARRPGVEVAAELVGRRPAGEIPADHPLVRLAVRCLEEQGVRPCLNIGSTDANIPLSLGFPAICVGLTHGSGAHTAGEYIHTRPLKQGLAQLVNLVEQIYCSGGL